VGQTDPGDSTHFGTNDIDYINKYLTGVDQSSLDPVTIATTTTYNTSKLGVFNAGKTATATLSFSGASNSTVDLNSVSSIPNVITVGASGANFTTLQAAINSLTGTPTIIQISPGNYSTSSSQLPVLTQSNVWIQGAGMGVTTITADTSVTGDTPILDIHGAVSGSSFALTGDTAPGDTTISVSAANSTNFSAGNFILLRSNKQPDTEFTSVHAGEICIITAVNTSTGVITLRDEVNDSYLVADSASIIKVNMVSNVKISDITFTSAAATSTRTAGFIWARFLYNFTAEDMEVSKGWWAGLQMSSCINSRVQGTYVHETQDPSGPTGSTHYGVVIHAASKNIVVDTCQFSTLRHSITMGGQTGTNFEGVVRSVTATNCTSETTDTAHFDTHQACENIVLSSCTAIGGVPATGNTGSFGYQIRSPKTSLVGCKSLRPKGKGIYVFGAAVDTVIDGCTVDTCKQFNSAGGDAVYVESGIKGTNIDGCTFSNCDGHALTGGGTNDDTKFGDNIVDNCSVLTLDGNVRLTANNVGVENNRFKAGPNRPIQMTSTSDNWTIMGNDFTGMSNTAPATTNTGSIIARNKGYNQVGLITNPFAASGSGDITNSTQAAANPATGTTHTVRFTPKHITVTGGTVSSISINGSASVGTSGAFYLDVGDTINITFSVAPTVRVTAE
jgi:hypothetical protein